MRGIEDSSGFPKIRMKKRVFPLLQHETYLGSPDHPVLLLVAYQHVWVWVCVCVCACVRASVCEFVRAHLQGSPILHLKFRFMNGEDLLSNFLN